MFLSVLKSRDSMTSFFRFSGTLKNNIKMHTRAVYSTLNLYYLVSCLCICVLSSLVIL